jgi:hypothetical protein
MKEKRPTPFEEGETEFIIDGIKTELAPRRKEREKNEEEERTEVAAPTEVKESRESLVEIAEILKNADRLTVELYDARIAEAGSPEEMREVVKDLNALLELKEASPCEPPCEHLDSMGDKEKKSANQTYLLRLVERGREIVGVYKPVKGEETRVLKAGIEDYTLYKREWLACMVDRALELGVVPPTVLRDEDKGLGSVQAFVQEADTANKVPDREKNPEDLVKVAILHLLTGQQDGHRGNELVKRKPEGGVKAIDNSETFGAALYDETGRGVFPALEVFSRALEEAKDISTAAQAPLIEIHVRTFLDSPRRQEVLKKAFDFVLGEESDEVWETFIEKAKDLLEKKHFSKDYDADMGRNNIRFGWSQEQMGATTKRKIAEAA